MYNYGLIIWHLRTLAGLSVQQTAKKIGKSAGWLSEVENNSGRSRLREKEFLRIVELLDGTKHKAMFKIWVASHTNSGCTDKTFDGAILKFIRIKKKFGLKQASKATALSIGQLSKIETGLKPVSFDLRNRIMRAYGYNPSSFKNFSTDPVRSKVVPLRYKLTVLLNNLEEEEIDKVFYCVQGFINKSNFTAV